MRRRVLRYLAVLVLIGTGFLTTGCLTGTIEGQVVDQNDRPITGAIVTTDPPTHSIRTTENGYRLENVPVGEYVVEAEKPGYHVGKVNVQVSFSQTTAADIQVQRKQ